MMIYKIYLLLNQKILAKNYKIILLIKINNHYNKFLTKCCNNKFPK